MSLLASAIRLAEEGHEKFEAHNPILPENSEIVLGTIAFLIIAFALWKFGLPAAKKMSAERTNRIANQLSSAASSRVDAEADAQRITSNLTDIESERGKLLADARKQAAALKADQLARIDADIVEARQRAIADIEASNVRAVAEIQADIARLSVGAAEQLVGSNLDSATQQALVEDFIAKVGATKVGI
ncbi:MAG: hypothetical protein AB7L13_04435 [Acidimicrobiia bacterium]